MNAPLPRPKIALLIDADNASAKHIDETIQNLEKRGDIHAKLIFGDWGQTNLSGWNDAILKHALKQNQQNSYVKGKNATDIALVIAAMQILHTQPEIALFAIMSSDSDFTPLVQRLRQERKTVVGFVANNASVAFRQVCSECITLGENTPPAIWRHRTQQRRFSKSPNRNH